MLAEPYYAESFGPVCVIETFADDEVDPGGQSCGLPSALLFHDRPEGVPVLDDPAVEVLSPTKTTKGAPIERDGGAFFGYAYLRAVPPEL
ncbi:hypothetical protein [Streptomyces sp. DSM 15324]|uniref:hypothetical protein n=1 Tax=Streptomyces sp. DSM 15324 TaxID=1739111 RepID=UPI0007468477|nr:hypothetical protein [Streptomyces sp. DSM 15324]KUO10829.1 hypothetical protein AQJ58_18055 [Streptomyces sp. DSM 15324]